MAQVISTNTFGCAKWIVSSDATQGTHTTIAGALTSASSGDTIFLRGGTYTENLTLKAGVNIAAYVCDAFTPNVTIAGTSTFTAAGTVSISGIRLQTNSAALLAVTGSAASIVNLQNCYLNCTNNTGITFSTSDATAVIDIINCFGDIGTTGIGLFTHSSAGRLRIESSYFTNTGNSTTASTASAGILEMMWSSIQTPITTSSTNSIINMQGCNFSTIVNNATCLTVGGSGGNAVVNSNFTSGTASAISIGSALTITNSTIGSSNTNAITGAGTIQYTGLSYSSTSSLVNTTTKSALNTHLGGLSFNVGVNTISSFTENTWTPTLALATPGTSSFTYTAQVGRYWQLGNFVWISARVILSNFTIGSGSGNVLLASLPFTIANVTNQNPVFSVWMQNVTTDALVLWYQGSGTPGQANMTFNGTKSASAVIQLAAASLANTSQFIISGCYSLA